ncbi:MAG: 5-(carboxyamino)imidazole ribonucleotide synthase [Acidobacteria bacterium]|nr:5-(carboxyamino)imidazole ribonucleotide synthase [Acidobacteriota bacterium]
METNSRKKSAGPILPGAVIGVLGSGQLGRMFTIAARRMGYRVHTFSPETDTPTGQVADVEIKAHYDDLNAVRGFASAVDVVTFEFENVPSATAQAAAECAPVRPDGAILHTTQHRLREKTFLAQHGFPVTPFKAINTVEELRAAVAEFGFPCVLKTAGFGYDGKGQAKLTSAEQAETALQAVGHQEMVLEAFVEFSCELSVIGARGVDGSFAHWGVIRNDHRNHILDVSFAPPNLPPEVVQEAVDIARAVLETLGVVGVLCVEFFLTTSGKLLINELAPRPHNSGHLTFDACVTSQFEQQLRAVCGLPLGATAYLRPAAMANLLGDLWQAGEPDWAAACAFPEVKLHLYGKMTPKPGRKMGHLTALADTADQAARLVQDARAALQRTALPTAG